VATTGMTGISSEYAQLPRTSVFSHSLNTVYGTANATVSAATSR
jgi:hypothetical protein